jgi:hypothetical protein
MDKNNDFAAALDAVITDPNLRKEIDRAPAETLAKLGVDASPAAEAKPAARPPVMFAPPYVPVGPGGR